MAEAKRARDPEPAAAVPSIDRALGNHFTHARRPSDATPLETPSESRADLDCCLCDRYPLQLCPPMTAPDPITPAEIAEIERVTVLEMQRAPADAPFDVKSIALHLKHAYPRLICIRTIDVLRATLRKVARYSPDRTHIMLKDEYQNATVEEMLGSLHL